MMLKKRRFLMIDNMRTELPIVLRTKVASGRKCVIDKLGMTFGCHWLHSVQPRRHASVASEFSN